MEKWQERTGLLLGQDLMGKIGSLKILVVGLGGVGSFAAEFLCRTGVKKMVLVDGDLFDTTNINRQLMALHSTVGKSKAAVLQERLKDISPAAELKILEKFLLPEDIDLLLREEKFDFVLDCIDSITPKIHLLQRCWEKKIPIFSSMGAGGKIDPSQIHTGRLSETIMCPMAKNIRKRLKKINPKIDFEVVFSTEKVPETALQLTDGTNFKRSFYGTIGYIPAAFGMHMAALVVKKVQQK